MDLETTAQLIQINREFYQHFAVEFDRTRSRLQPGVARLVGRIASGERVLDLGCGNGGLWKALKKQGFADSYTGLDFSPALVRIAGIMDIEKSDPGGPEARFMVRDLAESGWDTGLNGPFDRILAFAVLHHLPSPIAEDVLACCRRMISPDGFLALSNWQFLDSPRWRLRIQPWERVGIAAEAVGADDYLLDWRSGGTGLRYVHYYGAVELEALAARCGFVVRETSRSDGREGDLGLYQVWEPAVA